ncbi:nucleotidyltransferase domain-containing protein [Mucilaginibacter sp. ZB1P21]|uniref:Nucleotidyltransferase domain-containing protein n=2 Tax=Mucilaginibacter glaciei TaxID=2772109 RepID=A0A926NND5_9SPHI|nr:nucleotidyltransferase domain-containing protein [Mucilaginibacter glaciei]
MYGLSEQAVINIIEVLKQYPAVKQTYLYGSRAKGNFKPSSDIDLVLKGEQLDLRQLTNIMASLDDLLLPNKFDVAIYHQINNEELLDHIDRVGITIYNS